MAKLASKVIEQCYKWLGKKEADGSHKEIIDVYNSYTPLARGYKMKYSDQWCSCFVSAVAIKLGYTDIIPTEVGCEKHVQLFKNKGIWIEDESITPKVGDIILYDWDDSGNGDTKGSADHIGYVVAVDGKNISVIEGNYNKAVTLRKIKVNARYIRGYARPKYDEEPKAETKSTFELAVEVMEGLHGNGEERKRSLGEKYSDVQKLVNFFVISKEKSNETLAEEIWQGKWNVGALRKRALIAIGKSYNAVMDVVNGRKAIKVGDKVKVIYQVDYYGNSLAVSKDYVYDVIEVYEDRVVIGKGKKVTCAIERKNLKLVE